MEKQITGKVRQNPILLDQCCLFMVEEKEGTYLVLSTERQACKDNIFVEQGQEIHIKGSSIEDKYIKGIIVTKQAEIRVRSNIEKSF